MNMNSDMYRKYATAHAPKTPILKNCVWAFCVGGLICVLGQGIIDLCSEVFMLSEKTSMTLASISIATIAIILTAFGVFDKLARHAGAGTLVPISGFANSVASSAIDSKSEGVVLGEGAKIFTVAGPVLLYGTLASSIYGLIYWGILKFTT